MCVPVYCPATMTNSAVTVKEVEGFDLKTFFLLVNKLCSFLYTENFISKHSKLHVNHYIIIVSSNFAENFVLKKGN